MIPHVIDLQLFGRIDSHELQCLCFVETTILYCFGRFQIHPWASSSLSELKETVTPALVIRVPL